MVLYFSGTGNSEYAAKRIGKEMNDEVISLFEKIRNNDCSQMYSERQWVIVVPTYAWRIPRIVEKWLAGTELAGSKDIYFVMTCGSDIGNAGKYLERFCAGKKMNYCGCIGITMPENYIAMFSTPAEEEAMQIIERAEETINQAAFLIKNDDRFPQSDISLSGRISSGIVNDIFYPMFVHARKFYATDNCISCGKCASFCPLHNIRLENGRPVWRDNCTHCMACICRCPKEAIEYGKHSRGLPRYSCPKQA